MQVVPTKGGVGRQGWVCPLHGGRSACSGLLRTERGGSAAMDDPPPLGPSRSLQRVKATHLGQRPPSQLSLDSAGKEQPVYMNPVTIAWSSPALKLLFSRFPWRAWRICCFEMGSCPWAGEGVPMASHVPISRILLCAPSRKKQALES